MSLQASAHSSVSLTRRAESESKSSGVQRLMPNRVLSVQRTGQTLRILRGTAWITLDCRDVVLRAGDSLRLAPGYNNAIIEAMRGLPLEFEWVNG